MGEIYIIRHAEAEGNRYRRIHGHTDTNVTKNGLRQIEALQKRFENAEIHAVYSSDLTRTCRTAMAIAQPRGLEIRKIRDSGKFFSESGKIRPLASWN